MLVLFGLRSSGVFWGTTSLLCLEDMMGQQASWSSGSCNLSALLLFSRVLSTLVASKTYWLYCGCINELVLGLSFILYSLNTRAPL